MNPRPAARCDRRAGRRPGPAARAADPARGQPGSAGHRGGRNGQDGWWPPPRTGPGRRACGLAATGREPEPDGFAGLISAAARAARRRRAPARQPRALAGALGLAADPGAPDRLLTGVAVLTLLSDLSEHSPVLVVADDAHWLDRSSLDALAFAASRLDAEPVVLLAGARGQAPPPALTVVSLSCISGR